MTVRVPVLAACLSAALSCSPAATPKKAGGAPKSGPSAAATGPSAPSGLPPMAEMPPPGVRGSKKAKIKEDAKLASCADAADAKRAGAPSARVKAMGDACAAASKMRVVGAMMSGNQAASAPHEEMRIKLEAGKCYRIYFAFEGGDDAVLILRDSAGDIVAEAPAPALPQRGRACLSVADDATLLFGAGSGKGAWAAQLWSD